MFSFFPLSYAWKGTKNCVSHGALSHESLSVKVSSTEAFKKISVTYWRSIISL